MAYEIELLRQLFDYHEDGFFVRRVKTGPQTYVGQEVHGYVDVAGYHKIGFSGKTRLLHRCIFAWHHGYYPVIVDHEDRDKGNNRIENLRKADHVLSSRNQGPNYNNKTGVKGVFPYGDGRYFAQISRNKVRTYLGIFDSVQEAAAAIEEVDHGVAR
jgi:hypothetical protein